MIENYKHIIWDWNGTLVNDIDLCVDLMNGLLIPRKLNPITKNEYRNIFTFPVKYYYEKVGFDFSKYSFEKLGAEWMDNYERRKLEIKLFENTIKVLDHIKDAGISQSILSAYMKPTLDELVEYFQLKKYFSFVSGLDHIYATGKLELGMELMKKINCSKNEVLLIGDTLHDFDVAKKIGANCVLIANGHQSKEKLLKCGVPVLNDINDLIE